MCRVSSYYNWAKRLADGSGVELEASWTEGELTLTRDDFAAALAAKKEGTW
jgi:hypothetical protein